MTENTLPTAPWWMAAVLSCLTAQAGSAELAKPASAASAASATSTRATATALSADAVYQRERAVCNQDATPQGRSTCLKEAGAAHAEAKRKQLGNGEDGQALGQNTEMRCRHAAIADQDRCLRMARGEGTVSGSVDGGGLLKTLVTPVAAPAASR